MRYERTGLTPTQLSALNINLHKHFQGATMDFVQLMGIDFAAAMECSCAVPSWQLTADGITVSCQSSSLHVMAPPAAGLRHAGLRRVQVRHVRAGTFPHDLASDAPACVIIRPEHAHLVVGLLDGNDWSTPADRAAAFASLKIIHLVWQHAKSDLQLREHFKSILRELLKVRALELLTAALFVLLCVICVQHSLLGGTDVAPDRARSSHQQQHAGRRVLLRLQDGPNACACVCCGCAPQPSCSRSRRPSQRLVRRGGDVPHGHLWAW